MTIRSLMERTGAPHLSIGDYLASLGKSRSHRICNVDTGPNRPWLTLVIGSGCATSKKQMEALVATVARLQAKVESVYSGRAIDGQPIAERVTPFAEDLIRDRLRLPELPSVDLPPAGHDDVERWLADMFVASVMLTKIYFRAKSATDNAPRRPDHGDEAAIGPANHAWWSLKTECIDPAHEIVQRLEREAAAIAAHLGPEAQEAVEATVLALMSRLAGVLHPPEGEEVEIGLWDVQALAEFAWLCLSASTSTDGDAVGVYPGWTDLLVDLSNVDDSREGRVGVPSFRTIAAAQDVIRSRYLRITHDAWIKGDGNELYRAAATLLIAEEERRLVRNTKANQKESGGEPPLAAAFVTSFDMELELALLRQGAAFTVVLPVHVINTVNQIAHTCWLGLRVPGSSPDERPEERLPRLLEPGEDQVSIVGGSAELSGPLVVRLAGCPLIDLPNLQKANRLREKLSQFLHAALFDEAGGRDEQLTDIQDQLDLQPAVVISERDAILQNALDLLPSDERLGSETGFTDDTIQARSGDKKYGLYPAVNAGRRGWARFWVLLGVQIRDTAVRQRLATLVSAASLSSDLGAPTNRNGVAVNRYVTELEQDLLFWSGFDVVIGNAVDFADELDHFAKHLNNDAPFLKGACRV
jgi:hypothetical protein